MSGFPSLCCLDFDHSLKVPKQKCSSKSVEYPSNTKTQIDKPHQYKRSKTNHKLNVCLTICPSSGVMFHKSLCSCVRLGRVQIESPGWWSVTGLMVYWFPWGVMHLLHSMEPQSNANINTGALGGQMHPHTHGPCSHINTVFVDLCVCYNKLHSWHCGWAWH